MKGGDNMYQNYYFNIYADINGYHEIHTENCSYLPSVLNREYIGYFSSCQSAKLEAMRKHPDKNFDGCYFCCRECHRG